MFIVIINLNKVIVFKKNFGEAKRPMEYLLINAALDTQEDLTMENYCVQSKLFASGHRLLISHKIQEKVSKKFIELIDQFFIQDMLNPYVDDNISLSQEFSEKVEDAFIKTMININISI